MQKIGMLATSLICVLVAASSLHAQQTPADSAWDAGAHDVAERLYAARLAADSSDVMALRRIGTLRAWAGRYAESIALYDRAVRLAPNDALLALERARVLAWDRRYDAAIAAVDGILARDPGDRAALEARAQFTSWAGRYDESLSAYGQLIDISPGDASVLHARARVLGWAREYEEAARMYEQLLRANPGDRELMLGLAQVLAWGGRADTAQAMYRRMLEQNPQDMDALKGIARSASWSGDLRRGERYWRDVLAVNPADIEALVGLGANLRWQGRDAGALRVLRQAAALDSTDAELRVQLAYARAAVAPRFAPSYTAEDDSDDNSIRTTALALSARPVPDLELRANVYHRDLTGLNLFGTPLSFTTYGVLAGAAVFIEPGWTVSAQSGLTMNDIDRDDARPVGRLSASSPVWFPVTFTATVARATFDYTAALADNDVYTDQASLELGTRLTQRWRLNATASFTEFKGADVNRQVAGSAATTYRVAGPLTVGVAGRAFTFEKDRSELQEGYFNPDFYGIAELTAALYHEWNSRWILGVEAAPGIQRIGSDADATGSFRVSGRAAWAFAPGRQLGVSAAYANSGLQQLSATTTPDYDYRAFSAFMSWTF